MKGSFVAVSKPIFRTTFSKHTHVAAFVEDLQDMRTFVFGNQSGNHEKRLFKASTAQETMHRRKTDFFTAPISTIVEQLDHLLNDFRQLLRNFTQHLRILRDERAGRGCRARCEGGASTARGGPSTRPVTGDRPGAAATKDTSE